MKNVRPQCEIAGCKELIWTRNSQGWCCKHYRRWQRWGDPLKVLRQQRKPLHLLESDPIARFWQRINQTPGLGPNGECWEWVAGRVGKSGYGCLLWNGRTERSHRVAFYLEHGIWPSLDILHRCNNPACCRPSHLYEGTDKENASDRIKAGTHVKGADSPLTSLTDDDVKAIRRRYATGELMRIIAMDYGISREAVSKIIRRATWRHINDE